MHGLPFRAEVVGAGHSAICAVALCRSACFRLVEADTVRPTEQTRLQGTKSAAAWAIGSHGNNYQYANAGRKAVLASGVAALLIGAAPTLVNFLFQTGHGIH